jgi:copper chaperone
MPTTGDTRNLLLDTTTGDGGGCGCGGCGCGSSDVDSSTTAVEGAATTAPPPASTITATYAVNGMTCGHCVNAVTTELTALGGVTDVKVDLVADGTSTVTVTSERPIEEERFAAALEEAGEYVLA